MKNILLSMADDQRWDMIGSVGDPRVRTPNFDAMAAQGTVWTNARCQNGPHAAVCIPSRAALHTGREVAETNLQCDGFPTIGSTLREAGYNTHAVGKWHNGKASLNRSFASGEAIFLEGMHDHIGTPLHAYDPAGRYDQAKPCAKFSSEAFADAAIHFLHSRSDDRPFFLYIGWTSPHDPRTPPEEFARLYRPSDLELPPNFLPEHPFDNGELTIRDEMLAAHPRSPVEIQQHLADYFGMVSELDHQWGRVMAVMNDLGLLEETLVIHTADHGLAVGQHGLMGKQNLYEHSVRVPLIVSGPGVPRGRANGALCYNFDLAPTILQSVGVAVPETMTAQSLWGSERDQRKSAIAWYRDCQRSYTDGEWKLIEYRVGEQTRQQLFNLRSDPWERCNLADEAREKVRQLAEGLPSWAG